MKLQTLEDLLVHQIQDILSAEQQVKKALPRMAEAAGSDKLRTAFKDHQKETEIQIERLEKAFKLMDKPVSASHCEAAEGLITEAEGYIDGDGNRAVLDAGIVTAAQRFEHYEIAAYGSAISFARQLKRNEVADLLQESLDEETAADKKLTSIAENGVNDAAMKAGS
ncbi:MAG: ferritin-like domain-containing protein [Gemmatimonadota bacterium]